MQPKTLFAPAALSIFPLAHARPSASLTTLSTRSDPVSNSIWCGYVKNAAVQSVSAVWVVPDVSLPSPGLKDDYELFQWVGIDGAAPSNCNNALLQGGTAQIFNNGTYTTDFWYEFYTPSNPWSWHVTDPPVKIGDTVRVTVTATDSYSGTILFENLTQRRSASQKVKGDLPLCFEHVEWITEAPTQRLPNFQKFDFSSVSAVGKNGKTLNAAGSSEWYIPNAAAKCSASLKSGGSGITFSQG